MSDNEIQVFNVEEYDPLMENSSKNISGKDRLKFAKQILFFLFILVILVFSCSYLFTYFCGQNKEMENVIGIILDITKTAVPSTATLVLGFYFGKNDSEN